MKIQIRKLRNICYRKAHEMYGEDLPVQVSSRLEKELNSIISNGYAVNVYHCTEACVEIQCGRISGGIEGICRLLLCGYHGGDHGSKSIEVRIITAVSAITVILNLMR